MLQTENNIKLVLVKVGIIVSVFFIFIIIALFEGVDHEPNRRKEKEKINRAYFRNFNESFSGVIVDINTPKKKLKGGLQQSLIKIKLEYSTTRHYDPRDSLLRFFCLIDYPYAEVIKEHALGYTSIGDSFIYNGIIDSFYIKLHRWVDYKPNISDNNIRLLKPFYTIPKYTPEQLEDRKKTYPKPLELSNDYYMLLFGKFSKKEKLAESYKKLSSKSSYKGWTIPKYFERRFGSYYFFLNDKRYGSYQEVYKAWKEAGYSELYIAKFDKHNRFIKVLEKQNRK